MVSSPARLIILLLVPLMLLELVGMAADGRNRYGTFEGGIMLMAATLAVVWNVIGGTAMFLVRKSVRKRIHKSRLARGSTFHRTCPILAQRSSFRSRENDLVFWPENASI